MIVNRVYESARECALGVQTMRVAFIIDLTLSIRSLTFKIIGMNLVQHFFSLIHPSVFFILCCLL